MTEPARRIPKELPPPPDIAHVIDYERPLQLLARYRVPPDWVDDVVQETLTAVVVALREGRVRNPDELAGYVYGTARNVISNLLRHDGRRSRTSLDDVRPTPRSETPDPLEIVVDKERREAASRCLDAMREEDRHVLYLAFHRGMKPREIAAELDVEPHVARQRKWRAMKRFETLWLANGLEH